MHFDFITPKGLKITQSDGKKREEQQKEDNRVKEKKTDISFNFYIVFFGDISGEKKKRFSGTRLL